ncbi:Fanconi anemia group M protein isoform X1 [Podarcis lilfordi]|uniref:ATP-dependent RNA helicase FANCM n=1 Tax=Podarcis lilfordi TaxID=74358 RepID=A0AA35JRT9_9SAUR|nr:Fanconi anemia group M protein isoform X1 [Podarcis lilfordi]
MRGLGRGDRQATLFQVWGTPPPAEEEPPPGPPSGVGFAGGAAGGVWLFPAGAGVEERGYQARAARAALFQNTLLCLPTGLGKTLVAAVVLGNFYRWFPGGKALFLAPTKPLVAQQRDACAALMAIPARHMAALTGGTQVADRKEIWQNKRVFFLTPQIMANDLSRGVCPAVKIKCLVIDEAHRALGNHAYCQVVKELCKYTRQFRILALSATPGSDTKAVQQVISNLLISHIELCTEDSPDIQPYTHQRQVEKCVVPLGKELAEVRNAYIKVLETFAGRLIRLQVLSKREIPALTKYQIILARDQFRKNPSRTVGMQQGAIEGDFALCISLYHGYELLLQMGMRSLYIFLCGIMDGSKGMTRTKNELGRNEDFMMLYSQLENMFADTNVTSANGDGKRKPFIYSHPKLKKLEDVVVEHFRSWKERGDQSAPEGQPGETRVMIFSSFRDSVQEIAEMLSQHHPEVRVMTFVGHSTGKSTKGFTQKEQLEVVKRFREGGYNTLVSTCVGEEGLDIGEVDLIVCFDAQKSPIRLVQRMGRTGRKREGRIVVILSEGREERTYNQSQLNRRSLLKAISENKGLHLYQHSPRMIPEGIDPKMHRMPITPVEREPSPSKPTSKGRRDHALLLQKWLPYPTGADAKQTRPSEAWCLTAEEFERWNRLYKIKAGDGIRNPVLPRSHFETLEDEETRDSQAKEVHVLSLTEWRLWQNRPFPTHLVDHSDRCHHFISMMEMIEQMRHEEGECHYELDTRPYFHWEDVEALEEAQRGKRCRDAAAAQKAPFSRKTLAEAPKAATHRSSSSVELDAECVSLFKATSFKSANRPQALSVDSESHATEGLSPADGFPVSTLPLVEGAGCKKMSDKDEENMEESASISTAQRSVADRENAAETKFQPISKVCGSWNGHGADSGYGCFAEENSPLSSLFYAPAAAAVADFFVLAGASADEDAFWGKCIPTNAARLLSQSPPSLNELFDSEEETEDVAQQLSSVQKCVSGVFAGKRPSGEKLTPFKPPSTSPQNMSELTDAQEQCSLDNPLEKSCIPEASFSKINDFDWDEIFACDDEKQMGIQGRTPPVANHDPGANHSGKEAACRSYQGSQKLAERNASPTEVPGRFFIGEDFAECGPHPDTKGGELSDTSLRATQASTLSKEEETSERQPSGEELHEVSQGSPMKSLRIPRDGGLEASVDPVRAGKEEGQRPGEFYNVSQELFSVNFDLGFLTQESEDECSEQVDTMKDGGTHAAVSSSSAEVALSNSNMSRKSPLTWGNECFNGTKFSTPLHLQNRDSCLAAVENVIPLVSPLTPARGKLCQSPSSAHAAFSTPTGRQVSHAGIPRRTFVSSFSGNRQESPQAPVPRRGNASTVKRDLANSIFSTEGLALRETSKVENGSLNGPNVLPIEVGAGSESEEEIVFLRKNKKKVNVFTSQNIDDDCDLESPVCAVKKRRHPLVTSDLSSDASPGCSEKSWSKKPGVKRRKRGDAAARKNAAKYFLDQEAELSEEGAMEVSSDESIGSENVQSSSLIEFLNDETQIMQDLNESEMHAVYLKSVRSPAVGNRYKMQKGCNSVAVFSQVPEQDESYLADSFCVEEVEDPQSCSSEDEEVCVDFNLLQESFGQGRKQYCTRRRRKLKEAAPPPLKKRSRIQIPSSSSEDEGGVRREPPPAAKADQGSHASSSLALGHRLDCRTSAPKAEIRPPQESRTQGLVGLKSSLSEDLDFQATSKPESSLGPLAALCSRKNPPLPLCVLVDSREISSGPDVISTLKAVHGVKVHVCSLGSCDYVVSSRLAVERRCQAELLNPAHRSRVVQRVQQLKSKFDRICVIVEERVKAGEARRVFHRSRHYDSLLLAFVQAGIRVLFSSCQEETADLLKELASLEQRKNAAIQVPTEVQGHRQDALRFYLSIPCVSYPEALALCHCFGSVKEAANSSPGEMAARTRVSQQKAEKVYHYMHYAFDAHMLPEKIT